MNEICDKEVLATKLDSFDDNIYNYGEFKDNLLRGIYI